MALAELSGLVKVLRRLLFCNGPLTNGRKMSRTAAWSQMLNETCQQIKTSRACSMRHTKMRSDRMDD